MKQMYHIDPLKQYLTQAVCPVMAVDAAMELLEAEGFEQIALEEDWQLVAGHKYMVSIYDTGFVAFTIPAEKNAWNRFCIGAAHTDSPCYKIKSNPEMTRNGYQLLNVEPYGGMIKESWFDRPLSIAGRVAVRDQNDGSMSLRHICIRKPIMTIPNLCIHFQRGEEPKKISQQKEMIPITAMENDVQDVNDWLMELLMKEAYCSNREEILDYDLYLYSTEEPIQLGLRKEFLQAGRLDNLVSVYSLMRGLIGEGEENNTCFVPHYAINVVVCFDNEEVGSRTKQGADSMMLDYLLEKIADSLGLSHVEYHNRILNSRMLSVDAAHAIHPNYADRYDPTNPIRLDDGVVLKLNSAQHYASDLTFMAEIEAMMRDNNLPYKKFYNHSDIRGGSTMGPMLSANLPMMCIDVGIPMLAMHSIKELCSVESVKTLIGMLNAFYHSED